MKAYLVNQKREELDQFTMLANKKAKLHKLSSQERKGNQAKRFRRGFQIQKIQICCNKKQLNNEYQVVSWKLSYDQIQGQHLKSNIQKQTYHEYESIQYLDLFNEKKQIIQNLS